MEPPHLKWMLGEADGVRSLNQKPPALSASIRPKWLSERKKRAGAGIEDGGGWNRQTGWKGHPVSLSLFLQETRFRLKVLEDFMAKEKKNLYIYYKKTSLYINSPPTINVAGQGPFICSFWPRSRSRNANSLIGPELWRWTVWFINCGDERKISPIINLPVSSLQFTLSEGIPGNQQWGR